MRPAIGIASAIGGSHSGSQGGPVLLREKFNTEVLWTAMIHPSEDVQNKEEEIARCNQALAEHVYQSVKENPFTLVVGGDHSCGIGTWSGVATALHEQSQELGLIWLDAHMDCHTNQTTISGNIHGMPVATLLGHGSSLLRQIGSNAQKVKAENLFLVGIRSYEDAESDLVKKQGVRVYYVEEVLERGLYAVLDEIISTFKKKEMPYGISLDIDFFDPAEMSATGSPVENGPHPNEFLTSCELFQDYPPIVFEYVEFNPPCDTENKSLEWSLQILENVVANKSAVHGEFANK